MCVEACVRRQRIGLFFVLLELRVSSVIPRSESLVSTVIDISSAVEVSAIDPVTWSLQSGVFL